MEISRGSGGELAQELARNSHEAEAGVAVVMDASGRPQVIWAGATRLEAMGLLALGMQELHRDQGEKA